MIHVASRTTFAFRLEGRISENFRGFTVNLEWVTLLVLERLFVCSFVPRSETHRTVIFTQRRARLVSCRSLRGSFENPEAVEKEPALYVRSEGNA